VLIQPRIQWVTGTLSPGAKWPKRKAENSPVSRAEVRNKWSYIVTPPTGIRGAYRNKVWPTFQHVTRTQEI
jgi:hypothetical protein